MKLKFLVLFNYLIVCLSLLHVVYGVLPTISTNEATGNAMFSFARMISLAMLAL